MIWDSNLIPENEINEEIKIIKITNKKHKIC